MPAPSPPRPLWPLVVLYATSGAGALVVETTWMRWLRDLLGATAPAAAATTVAFFAGSALGAIAGARWALRCRDRGAAVRLYAAVESSAALLALATPLCLVASAHALEAVYTPLASSPAALTAVRFAVALLATAPAAIAYGATWPAMGAAVLPGPAQLGSRGSALYASNTLGAATGAGAAAWWLPPLVGVDGTYGLGIALSVVAAVGAWSWGRREPGPRSRPSVPPVASQTGSAASRSGLGLAALVAAFSGFVGLAAQVATIQAFAQVMNQSVAAFGAVMVSLLVCLSLGAYAVAILGARSAIRARTILGWSLTAAALAFAALPMWLTLSTGGLEDLGAGSGGLAYAFAAVGLVALVAGPALLAAACLWPGSLALAAEMAPSGGGGAMAGARIGILTAANTLGAIAGAVSTPFLLIPLCGLWGAFLALAALCALAAVALPPEPGTRRWPRDASLAVGWAVVLGLASPVGLPLTRTVPGERVVDQRSTPAGVVSVVERGGDRLIRVDNHYALGGTGEQRHEERQGHLPLVLHGAPRRVAFVGTATGITAASALAHDVESIRLVELVPGVARAAERHFAEANRGVYADPRSRVVLDDARNYLRYTKDRFDVIVADLFVPWRAGTGALYTQEQFRAVRDHLLPGGLFCQWLPLYQLSDAELAVITATFSDVFPTAAMFRGDFYGEFPILALVGWRDRPAPPSRVAQAARRLAAAGVDDRWVVDPVALWSLYVAPAPTDPEGTIPRNLDGWPRIEFMAAAAHAGGGRGALAPLVGSAWIRRTAAVQKAAPKPDPLYPDLPPEARRARAGGNALQLASALFAAGRSAEASRALALAAANLPPSVLAEAPADPSASDVWFDRGR